MTKVEKYLDLMSTIQRSEDWLDLLDKPIPGRPNKTGYIFSASLLEMTMYFEGEAGAKAHHVIPEPLRLAMNKVLITNGYKLLKDAIQLMRDEATITATEAVREYEVLLEAAGIPKP